MAERTTSHERGIAIAAVGIPSLPAPERRTIVAFSHLRWDFVFQRPQHILSRLARRFRVLFVEEPVPTAGVPCWESHVDRSGVVVCRPHTPVRAPGFDPAQHERLAALLDELLAEHDAGRPVIWTWTPMVLPLLGGLDAAAVVYDCMDELSGFLGAPRDLGRLEAGLLATADVVFTGGRSLYRARRGLHPHVHCFPSSVDVAHFARARSGGADPADQAALPRPRLGFYGVIDERLDPALLDAVATAHPEWSIVVVGPVAKIDPASLPRRPNLHYPGQRPYEELPDYLGGWDVCLMPFARNAATRFISPTKTLEYMAAERPIVSTSIADVAEVYADVVHLADDPAEFVEACERALAERPGAGRARLARMREILAHTSWDVTADRMAARIAEAVARRDATRAA